MGFLGKKDREDPLIKIIGDLSQQLKDERDDHRKAMGRMIEYVGEQNELLRKLVSQYVGSGSNTSESLNKRLERKEQYVDEPEWGPVGDPFEGM